MKPSRRGSGKVVQMGAIMPMILAVSKLKLKLLEEMKTTSATLKDGLEPDPLLADVAGRMADAGLGALANVADGPNILLREADLITVDPEDAFLVREVYGWLFGRVSESVPIVVRILD